jgi:hypothetical protein
MMENRPTLGYMDVYHPHHVPLTLLHGIQA